MLTFLAHAHMFDATQQDVSLGLAHMFDATEHWDSSSFCFCRPNMVAVLTVHVRHEKNARGWPFVFKNLFFFEVGFSSFVLCLDKLQLMTVAMQLLFEL